MRQNLFDIQNLVVAITGGTGVLGSTIATYLAGQGAKIVILARNKAKGDALVDNICRDGGEAMFLACDVTDAEALRSVCDAIIARYGRIDVLLNGAGGNMPGAVIPPDKTCLDLDLDAMRSVVDLNLFGTVLPTQIFLEAMYKQGKGVFVNFSSESALRPLTRVAGYDVAKAAVTNYTKHMANELAIKFGENFRMNAIAPGFFLTEQNRNLMLQPDGNYTDRAKSVIAHTPFGRFGRAEELCGTIHYLISDASKFVTGTVVVVDGGFDSFSI